MKRDRAFLPNFLDGETFSRLMEIDQRPAPFMCNRSKRPIQGLAAVASSRTEYVAHQAMGVHPYKHRFFAAFNVAVYQRQVRIPTVHFALVSNHTKLAVRGVY